MAEGDDTTIYPNAMEFQETKRLLGQGTLEMVVDQGLALVAIRSGVPLTAAGKVGLVTMILGPIAPIVLAFTESWWWLVGVPLAAIGGFGFVRSQAVEAVSQAALAHEGLFQKFRDQRVIRFQFRE